jgi:hypothetical protein
MLKRALSHFLVGDRREREEIVDKFEGWQIKTRLYVLRCDKDLPRVTGELGFAW